MKKTLTMILAFALVFALGVGGTLAWLTDSTGEVKNVFTTSDINVELDEGVDVDIKGEESFKMVPGHTIVKDPIVTVKAGSEDSILFVKVDVKDNSITVDNDTVDNIINWTIADGWTLVPGETDVYYREVTGLTAENAKDAEFHILANDKVTVDEDVTKAMMEAIKTEPTMTFTAYAHQLVKDNVTSTKFTAAEAWALING